MPRSGHEQMTDASTTASAPAAALPAAAGGLALGGLALAALGGLALAALAALERAPGIGLAISRCAFSGRVTWVVHVIG